MISTKNIVNKLNAKIANSGLTEAEFSQIHAAEEFLTSNNVSIQANTVGDLPDGPSNIGRMIYVIDENDFYYYDDKFLAWSNDFASFVEPNALYAWGFNGGGELGTNDEIPRSSPVIVDGVNSWNFVFAKNNNSFAITDTGVLYAWGNNGDGELGINNTIDLSSPVTVVGGITNWSQASKGRFQSLGLTDTGVLYAWGGNNRGELGTNDAISRSSPVTVVGGITNWSKGVGGERHSLGLTDSGMIYGWGYNPLGQLGTNDTIDRSSPVTIAGGITNWSDVTAGEYHVHGLTDTGVLYAWGGGRYATPNIGQLGTNDTIDRSSPVTVVGGITNWSKIAAGKKHSLGLTDTGVLYAWGYGYSGKLGTNDAINRSSPVTVVGGITNWSSISAGQVHSLGLTDTGVLYAWGGGGFDNGGQLGTNDTIDRSSPVTVAGGITTWNGIDAGGDHSLAIAQISKGFTEA